jgi:hypothetical protein
VVIAVHKFDFRLVIHGTLNKWRPINESHVMTDSCSVIASVVTTHAVQFNCILLSKGQYNECIYGQWRTQLLDLSLLHSKPLYRHCHLSLVSEYRLY